MLEPEITTAAYNLKAAIDEYVIYNQIREAEIWDVSNAHGLSILLSEDPACYYSSTLFDFAGSPTWYCGPETLTIPQESGEWGQMLSDLILEFNPEPQPQLEPPPLVPLYSLYLELYIPLIFNKASTPAQFGVQTIRQP